MRERLRMLRGRARHRIARAALALPPSVQVRLAGGPIVVDGLALHPQMQMLLTLRKVVRARGLTHGTAEQARARVRREALEHAGAPVVVGAVRDLTIEGPGGPLHARHYAPTSAPAPRRAGAGAPRSAAAPLLVYFHGGGFVVGDVDTVDPLCRLLCRHAGIHVLSVDYRLAPEHPFPAAIEDGRAAFLWARDHAASLGADPARVGVGGDSAGGHLATIVSIELAEERRATPDTPVPALQLLLYPPICRARVRPSIEAFERGFFLERVDIERFQQWYAGHLTEHHPRTAPLRAPSHEGLPPALVVTAGFDPLRDEGEEYARVLEAAGNTVVARRFDDLVHGFVNLVGVSSASRDAVVEVAHALRTLFDKGDA